MAELSPDDALLRSIGASLNNWSLVELELSSLFSIISSPVDQNRAHILFGAILSFDARLAVCDRLMGLEMLSELDREMWAKMFARLSKYYKKRHELAHFTIDHTGKVPRISPFFTYDKWIREDERFLTHAEIKERSEKFIELHMALGWFKVEAFCRRGKRKRLPEPSRQEPPLIPRLRALAAQSLEERQPRKQSPSQ